MRAPASAREPSAAQRAQALAWQAKHPMGEPVEAPREPRRLSRDESVRQCCGDTLRTLAWFWDAAGGTVLGGVRVESQDDAHAMAEAWNASADRLRMDVEEIRRILVYEVGAGHAFRVIGDKPV